MFWCLWDNFQAKKGEKKEGGGGLLILKMISVIKNIIFMAFKIITVITLN